MTSCVRAPGSLQEQALEQRSHALSLCFTCSKETFVAGCTFRGIPELAGDEWRAVRQQLP